MTFRTPFASKPNDFAPFEACIRRAAIEAGATEFFVAEALTHFLEAVCDEVGKNRVVELPGFGQFGQRQYWPTKAGLRCYRYPAFRPSRKFRAFARNGSRIRSHYADVILRHRRHNHVTSRPERCSSRPPKAFAAFRRQIAAQARRCGLD